MKKYNKWGALLLSSMIMFSCNDKLEVTPPNDIIDEQIVAILNGGDEKT